VYVLAASGMGLGAKPHKMSLSPHHGKHWLRTRGQLTSQILIVFAVKICKQCL